MDQTADLQEYITHTALNEGAELIGITRIRRVEPVILLGFPYSDRWFLKAPLYQTKRLGEEYRISRKVQDTLANLLKSEGYTAHYKTLLSLYGDFRPLAVAAGLGDWGRNGLVVNERFGSNLLFAALFTNASLSPTPQEPNKTSHCTECGDCVQACPAHAFDGGLFHWSRCLPYTLRGCAECLKSCKAGG